MPKTKKTMYEIIYYLETTILIPAFLYLQKEQIEIRKELTLFQVKVASEYARNDAIIRIEQKIDDIRSLFIEEIKHK